VDQSSPLAPPVGEAAAGRHGWGWTPGKIVAGVALVNLVLGLVLFSLHPPWIAPPQQASALLLPAQTVTVQQQIASGVHGQSYAVSLSDGELTAALAYYASMTPDVPFTGIQATILADHVAIDAVTRGLAVPVPVHADVSLAASDGVPRAKVEEVSVAGAGLPAFVHAQVLSQANASLDLSRYELPLTVDSVQQRPGVLEFSGKLK
jgi:hypothetical protein